MLWQILMYPVYNLHYIETDKLGRKKRSKHVGVFKDLQQVSSAQQKLLDIDPTIIFEVFIIEHLFSRS